MSARRRMRVGVFVGLLACEAILGAVLGLAGNVASGLSRWPYGLDVVRRHSLRTLGIGVVLTVAVGVGLWWWDQRGEEHTSPEPTGEIEPEKALYRGGMMPRAAECFQDRDLIRTLEAALVGGPTAVLTQVLSGSGGVGKSQLAAHYARSREDADVVVWVAADSRDAIITEYARAGVALAGGDITDPQESARRFLRWLESTDRSWLIVLDDVSVPKDLIELWPPERPTGRTVVTTRRHDATMTGSGRAVIDVDVFTSEEAASYLGAKLAVHGRTEPVDQVRGLAQDLGCLPVALAQAVAYVIDARLTIADYRTRWADRRRTLPRLVPSEDALPDDQRRSLAAVWSLSIERADTLPPEGLARPMMQLVSMLDPNGIPLAALTGYSACDHLAAQGRSPSPTPIVEAGLVDDVSGEDASDALTALARLSLVTLYPADAHRSVRVHGVVQRAVREILDQPQHSQTAIVCANALLDAWPEIEHDSVLGQVMRANAESLRESGGKALWEPAAHTVLFRAGRSLGEAGLAADAVKYWQQMRDAAITRLGPDHIDALATRSELARWRGEAGDPGGAAAASEELLADYRRVLGPDHPDTVTIRHNLAYWRGATGDSGQAVIAFEELLAERLRMLGPDHPDTLTTRNNLAYHRGEAGDQVGATAAYEELLADRLRVLGPDHPDTLITRNNLAYKRSEAGDPGRAVTAFEGLLADQLRVLGPDHPDTLLTRHNLAYHRGMAGDEVGATAAYEGLLADQLRVLGPDHPDTLATRHNLAYQRGLVGGPGAAVTAFEELLADQLRVSGPDHPKTLVVRNNLAQWRGAAGDPSEAVAGYEALLADRLRVLGPDHPSTLNTRADLAYWREKAQDPAPE
jgi:NB-ARC domain/Tetratricopeptide repeat